MDIKKQLDIDYSKSSKFITEYERGLLSLIILKLDFFVAFNQVGNSNYFLYPPHKLIYTAVHNLCLNPDIKSVDFETILAECTNLGFTNHGVDPDYLMLLTEGVGDSNNFNFLFKKVKNAYLKYALSQELILGYKILINNAVDDDANKSGEELLNDVSNSIAKLMSFQSDKEDGVLFSDIIDDFIKERKNNPTDVKGLRTGFNTLDIAINGLLPGTLTVFAGVAGMGKSTALLNIADYVAIESENPLPVLYISTEMSKDEDLSRLIAMRTTYPEREISNGIVFEDPRKKEVLTRAYKQIKKSKIHHIYVPDFNATKICNYIHYYKQKYNIGIAIFDYIKLDTVDDKTLKRREDQVLGDLTTALKNIAGKLEMPVLAACQVNSRSGRVADSDRVIRYCNNLVEIWEQEPEEIEAHRDIFKHGTHWFKIKKARSGPRDWIPIRFWKGCLKMVEAEKFTAERTDDASSENQLTTPDDYESLRASAFKIDSIVEVANKLNSDMLSELEEDDANDW